MGRGVECTAKSQEWRNAFPQYVALVDAFSPELVHKDGDSFPKLLAKSFMEQTGRPLSPAEGYVLAEDGQEMIIDVICSALSNQPDVRNGWSSRAALEGHVGEVTTMLASFPNDSAKEKTIAVAKMAKARLEFQRQGIFDLNDQKTLRAFKPGIDSLARAINLSEREGKRRPAIFIPLLKPSMESTFS